MQDSSEDSLLSSSEPGDNNPKVKSFTKSLTQPGDPSRTYTTLNADGLLEEIDLETGISRPLEVRGASFDTSNHIPVPGPDGELVYIPKTMSLEDQQALQRSRSYPYSPLMAERIVEKVAEGHALTRLHEKFEGFPKYSTILRWRNEHEEFRDMLQQARRDRAETFFDEAKEAVEQATEDRDSVALQKLRSDFYKAAAKMTNSDEFTEKTKIDGNLNVGVAVVDTGVRRPGDPGYDEDETKKLERDLGGIGDE